MKLNIHILSHPIIQNLANTIKLQSLSSSIIYQNLRQLGLFITYETTRNWLKIYHLNIKQVQNKKKISIIDPKESYLIIFNHLEQLSLLQEIPILLPQVTLQLINKNDIKLCNQNTIELPAINNYTKVIITCNEVNIEYIENLLYYLNNHNNIQTNLIRLICIKCTTKQLIALSKKYNQLNIYTTQIIQN